MNQSIEALLFFSFPELCKFNKAMHFREIEFLFLFLYALKDGISSHDPIGKKTTSIQ